MDQLYTPGEVARLTRLSVSTIYHAVEAGTLRSVTVGARSVRVTSAALRSFMRERGGRKRAPKRKAPRRRNRPKKAAVPMTPALMRRIHTLRRRGASYQRIADKTGVSKGAAVIACGGLKTQKTLARKPKRKTKRRVKK